MKPGIYLDLDEEEYFAADALGSTDLKKLAVDPLDWWAGSRLNPDRFEAPARAYDADSMALGKAVHTIVLEGERAFKSRFCIKPDRDTSPSKRDIAAMRKHLTDKGVQTSVFISSPDAQKLCREHGIRFFEDLEEAFKIDHGAGHKTPITQGQHDRALKIAAAMADAPALAGLQQGGLSEVSVFWERDGVLLRARFDRLLPRFILDLKTVTPSFNDTDFQSACLWQIANYRYDIQAELYSEARRVAADFIKSKQVYGGTKADRGLLKKLLSVPEDATGASGWTWLWLFVQVPNDQSNKGRAFKALPLAPTLDPDWARIATRAREDVDGALVAYREHRETFGLELPWQQIADVWAPSLNDWPRKLTGVNEYE
jgi:hypothetical protein